jgi:hypothetical protein
MLVKSAMCRRRRIEAARALPAVQDRDSTATR